MLKHTKGNLIDMAEQGLFDVIVHGCNCQNTMGSGIAKEIRERIPAAHVADREYDRYMTDEHTRYQKLGTYTSAVASTNGRKDIHPFVVVNAYTQDHYIPRDVDHFEYTSFAMILQKLLHAYGTLRLGFPYIGMGLAGGDKDRIIALLEDFAEKVSAQGGTVTLVEFG